MGIVTRAIAKTYTNAHMCMHINTSENKQTDSYVSELEIIWTNIMAIVTIAEVTSIAHEAMEKPNQTTNKIYYCFVIA